MTRRQVVSYTITCDACGEEIPEDEAENAARRFGFERAQYQVDLCGRHQGELSEILDHLKVFVDAGAASGGRSGVRPTASPSRRRRRPSGAKSASGANGTPDRVAVIRAWAHDQGLAVGDRGRIPAQVVDAYNAAAGSTPAPAPARARRSRKAAAPAE